ncbi:MAG: GNAT family N-acetyltransferase [Alphaproteobacteria bacterium]|nr:GNAT family N-acetyltransferase [Alphaproteobacteria bacterium]
MTGEPHFRAAKMRDFDAVLRLLLDDDVASGREDPEGARAAYEAAFAEMVTGRDSELLLMEIGGSLVGMVQLTVIPGLAHRGARRAQLETLRVASAERGRKLGERLVEHALGRARERGCRIAQLTTDTGRRRAHAFYGRLGFTPSHVGFKRRIGP